MVKRSIRWIISDANFFFPAVNDALYHIPSFYVVWNIGSIISGAIFYEELDGLTAASAVMFGAGTMCVCMCLCVKCVVCMFVDGLTAASAIVFGAGRMCVCMCLCVMFGAGTMCVCMCLCVHLLLCLVQVCVCMCLCV